MKMKPLDIILHCPSCGLQHIDEADYAAKWTNPPHRSHLCLGCGMIWRPADVYTNGVAAIETSGTADMWPANPSDHRNSLSCWFGSSRASWLTIPRVLMESMPKPWQQRIARLLHEYDETFPNQPNLKTVVQVTEPGGRMVKTPVELIDYRRPHRDVINRWRGEKK